MNVLLLKQNSTIKTFFVFLVLFLTLQPIQTFAIAIIPIPTDPIPPVPISDSAIRSKEVELTISGKKIAFINYDVLAISALRILVNALGTYTVNWINNDFKTQPNGVGFPLDLERTLKNTGDALAGQIINQATGSSGKLCSPFRTSIGLALKSNANLNSLKNSDDFLTTSSSCPLSAVIRNGNQGIKDFMDGDFVSGGWNSWNVMTQSPTGNPYSSMFTIQTSIDNRVLSAIGLKKEQLSWSKGFLSTQDCVTYVDNASGKKTTPATPVKQLPANSTCIENGPVRTPGSVVEAQLQKLMGSEVDQLNVASNFNQIVTAMIGQLQKVLLNKAKGLFNPTGSGSGNYNANPNPSAPSAFGICSADKEFAIANIDTVTWSYSGTIDENTTFQWSGDEGLTSATETAKKIYTEEGIKLAQVIVTQKTASGEVDPQTGEPIITTNTSGLIDCDSNVTVSKFPPMILSCRAVDAVTGAPLKNNLPVGASVKWMITITGGSGELSKIDINENSTLNMTIDNKMKANEWNGFLPPYYLQPYFSFMKGTGPTVWFIGNPLPIPNNPDPVTKKNKLQVDFIVDYSQEGDWGFAFNSIFDTDGNVPRLKDVNCGKTYTIDSSIK